MPCFCRLSCNVQFESTKSILHVMLDTVQIHGQVHILSTDAWKFFVVYRRFQENDPYLKRLLLLLLLGNCSSRFCTRLACEFRNYLYPDSPPSVLQYACGQNLEFGVFVNDK